MSYLNPRQKILLSAEYLLDINPFKQYELLFGNLPSPTLNGTCRGRPSTSPEALLKSFIYKNLSGITSLSDLGINLRNNPSLCLKCGFDPSRIPSIERFSSFLKDTPNFFFQEIRVKLVKELINLEEISGEYLSIDSCSIPVRVKENNLKTSVKNRFSKDQPPKADLEAGLGIMVHYPRPFKKEIKYFWGYKNHILSDAKVELPIWEITKKANVPDTTLFIPCLKEAQKIFSFSIRAVIGDAAYDSEANLDYVIKELEAKPVIARNFRWSYHSDHRISSKGVPICMAGFDMIYWGRFKDRGKVRLKFVCPITHSKGFRKKIPLCPWNHPKFTKGKGCYVYLRGDKNIRESIDYGSSEFRKIYNLRVSSERILSRLLSLCMQNPTTRGFNAITNHSTIAHITVLLVALTAVKTGHQDKIRFVKNFLPKFLIL